jgi:hypothetical protein
MVMELRADVPWLLNPQMTTSVGSRSSMVYPARVRLRTGNIFTTELGSMSIRRKCAEAMFPSIYSG